jgi:hypothetical protein
MRGITGDVVMLNLLRLREMADYAGAPFLAPTAPISGREAHNRQRTHYPSWKPVVAISRPSQMAGGS